LTLYQKYDTKICEQRTNTIESKRIDWWEINEFGWRQCSAICNAHFNMSSRYFSFETLYMSFVSLMILEMRVKLCHLCTFKYSARAQSDADVDGSFI
jgi:hypothetical protein